jgi:hypothetical protein
MTLCCKSCRAQLPDARPEARCSVTEAGDVLCVPCSIAVAEELGHSEFAHWMIRVRDVHQDTAQFNLAREAAR